MVSSATGKVPPVAGIPRVNSGYRFPLGPCPESNSCDRAGTTPSHACPATRASSPRPRACPIVRRPIGYRQPFSHRAPARRCLSKLPKTPPLPCTTNVRLVVVDRRGPASSRPSCSVLVHRPGTRLRPPPRPHGHPPRPGPPPAAPFGRRSPRRTEVPAPAHHGQNPPPHPPHRHALHPPRGRGRRRAPVTERPTLRPVLNLRNGL